MQPEKGKTTQQGTDQQNPGSQLQKTVAELVPAELVLVLPDRGLAKEENQQEVPNWLNLREIPF